ncbi:hypothetical protein [Rhizobium chutanense]|uniref:hypothetical protein n=1 Tax=Rhizobium chutanense TaxID=2035448 RepID=UPI00117BC515|nr:hypothetical protein [Rhizobium chutanense]
MELRRLNGHGLSLTIDLAPLVQGLEPNEAHEKASQIFLDALWGGKPKPLHEWIRTPVSHQAPADIGPDDLIGRLVASWEADRKGYPGWLVAPSHHRMQLRFETDRWFSEMRKALPTASAPFRAKAISELSWRYEIAFWPLDDFMYDLFSSSVSAAELDNLSKSDRIRIYTVLLTQARHDRNWEDFNKWLGLLQRFDGAEVTAICRYQQALKAKADFDFPKLAELALLLKGDDPVWYLRQASLYCLLREYQKAAEIIREAKTLIHTRRSREKNSIWLLSREAWASWLFRSARYELEDHERSVDDDTWPNNYHAAGCDPWDHIHAIDSEISKQWEERAKEAVVIEASFDAGSYRDHSKTVRFRNGAEVLVIDEVIRMSEHVGLPDRIGTMEVMATKVQRAIQVTPQMSVQHVSLAATHIASHSKGLIDHVFSRVNVARLPHAVANELVTTLRPAIDFALQQIVKDNRKWVDTARVYLELLSRLMISQGEDVAKETFLWGMELSKHPGLSHWWLLDPLSHLLCRSLEAVPPVYRGELSYEALSLPLPKERNIAGLAREWPELCDEFDSGDFRNRVSDFKWNSRISELIEAVRTGDTLNRTRALLRLSSLAEETMLSVEEQSRLAVAIWDKRASGNGLPANAELYPHVYLIFPEPSEGLSASAFNEVIVKPLAAGEIDELRLVGLQGSSGERCKDRFTLSPQDALAILDKCIGWRPPAPKNHDFFGTTRDTSQAISKAVGPCLAWAVLPALTSGLLDDVLLTRWRDAVTGANVPSFLLTAAHLLRLFPSEREWVTKTLRKALAARDEATVVAALNATVQFIHLHKKEGIEIPSILSTDIASMCAVRREPGLLHSIAVARRLLMAGLLNQDDQLRIIDSLEFMLIDLDYKEWNTSDPRTKTLTLLRAECVRLAMAFQKAGRQEPAIGQWLEAKKTDAFPEVRFAELDDAN